MGLRRGQSTMSAEWRERIKTGVLLQRLMQHAEGVIEMTQTQIKAAEILLRKCIPDLAAEQHSGEITQTIRAAELPDDALAAIAAGSRGRVVEAPAGPQEPASVH